MIRPDPVRVFAGHDGGSGCAWYRLKVPLAELARHGDYQVTFADAGDDGHPHTITLSDLEGYNIIAAQRWNKHTGLPVWRRARGPYSRLVYELDDDLWSVTPENWKAYHLYNDPHIRDAVEHAAETADLVTVSTAPLADVMRQFNPNVTVLPNCIPDWVLDQPRTAAAMARTRLRVGWQGGASHGVDLGQVASPVRRFLRRFADWDLQLNGEDYRLTFRVPADRSFHVPWIPVYRNPDKYYASIDFDIGICPIWPTAFSDSKSGIKAIEYGARGIPVVATDCPAYRDIITHGVDGFLVRRDHEWLKYLSELASDSGLRAKMGEAARAMAARYVISAHWGEWAAAYGGMFR